jgi:hypothetical protein
MIEQLDRFEPNRIDEIVIDVFVNKENKGLG